VQGVGDTRRYLIPDSGNKIHGKPWKYKHSELYTISVDIKKEGAARKDKLTVNKEQQQKKETESIYTCIVKRSILSLKSVSTPNMSFLATADVTGSSTDAEDVDILPRLFPFQDVFVGGDGDDSDVSCLCLLPYAPLLMQREETERDKTKTAFRKRLLLVPVLALALERLAQQHPAHSKATKDTKVRPKGKPTAISVHSVVSRSTQSMYLFDVGRPHKMPVNPGAHSWFPANAGFELPKHASSPNGHRKTALVKFDIFQCPQGRLYAVDASPFLKQRKARVENSVKITM
jgi:hypothetical protein